MTRFETWKSKVFEIILYLNFRFVIDFVDEYNSYKGNAYGMAEAAHERHKDTTTSVTVA
jgi:hypothetical protein